MKIKMNEEKIVDKTNLNYFGVLFHDTKTIEDFQEKSGMEGSYSVEYQHHYINAVGRLRVEDQQFDIAIPLVLFNYHQEVGGASIEFNLEEVGKTNEKAIKTAIDKFKEFEKTDMYNSLIQMGFKEWELHGMNSVHCHPTGVNRFSGTDLRANINHPGVCYPLSTGSNVPNFASIIQHKENYAELIHTEYRIFNGIENGIRLYENGRCLTIIRGFEEEVPEDDTPKGPGPIDEIFGTTRPAPPAKPKPKKRNDYILKNNFTNVVNDEAFKSIQEDLMKLWKECDFEIDTSHIDEDNVQVGRGRLLNSNNRNTWGIEGYHTQTKKQKVEKINATLFDNLAEDEDEPTYSEMRKYLLNKGFTKSVVTSMPLIKLGEVYRAQRKKEQEEKRKEKDETEPPYHEMYSYLLTQGYEPEFLRKISKEEIIDQYWIEKLDSLEEEKDEEREELCNDIADILMADALISKEKIKMMTCEDIIKFFEEMYGDLNQFM